MRGAAVCVLLCIGSVVSNSGVTENREYGGGMTAKEEAGKRVIALRGGKNDVTSSEETHEDGSRSRIYKKETRGKLEDSGVTENGEYGGGMTVKEEAGKRVIVLRDGKNDVTLSDETHKDGSQSRIYKKETRGKLEDSGVTENGEYGGGMTVKEEAGKRVIVLRDGKNDVTLSDETHKDGSQSRIYKKETRGKLEGKLKQT